MKRSAYLAAGLAVLAVFVPRTLLADNLGGLVYLLFIWPAGAALVMVTVTLTIVLAVKRGREDAARRPSFAASVAAAATAAVLYAAYLLLVVTSDNAMHWPGMAALSVVPPAVPALAAVLAGLVCARDARRREKGSGE